MSSSVRRARRGASAAVVGGGASASASTPAAATEPPPAPAPAPGDDDSGAAAAPTDLAALQRRSIAFRAATLRELGLEGGAPARALAALAPPPAAARKRARPRGAARWTGGGGGEGGDGDGDAAGGRGARRSGRLASLPARPSLNEDALFAASGGGGGGGGGGGAGDGGGGGGDGGGVTGEGAAGAGAAAAAAAARARAALVPRAPTPAAPPSAGSSRGLASRLPWLAARFLGRFIPPRFAAGAGGGMKRAVMQAAAARGSRAPVVFSKYAGAQEWEDAVLLFANLFGGEGGGGGGGGGGAGGDAGGDAGGGASGGGGGANNNSASSSTNNVNVFLDGGRQFVWWAAANKHAGSPLVLRLVHSRGGAALAGARGERVDVRPAALALAVRLAPALPYVFCGPLAYASHAAPPGGAPVRFVFDVLAARALAAGARAAGRGALEAVRAAAARGGAGAGAGGGALEAEDAAAAATPDVEAAYAEERLYGESRYAAVLEAGGVRVEFEGE